MSAPAAFTGLPVKEEAFAHTSILASAGSGKTHALTNRYLQLVAAGAPIATILASTFTRAAAAEIRDRVLNRLSDAVLEKDKRTQLANALQLVEPGALTETTATKLLAQLVRNLHVGQLRTLDSFFAAVVRASCIELGLPIGAEVMDEEQTIAMRSEAIALMLDESKPQELVELLRQLTRGDAGRSVTQAIDAVVADLYELWREAPDEAWDCVVEPTGRLKPADVISEIEALRDTPVTTGKRHTVALADDVQRAMTFDWEAFLEKGIAAKVARGETKYYTELDPGLIAAYRPLVAHAVAEVVGKLRHQTLATRAMLALFHTQFEHLKHARSAITFGDLVLWCQRAIAHDSLETIAFRLDAQVRHLLLDEFQDTSISQWRALAPIVEEILSNVPPERSFFCVGDVKQSIYGWRGAAPEILQGIAHSGMTEVQTLARSFRSSPIVIDMVNQVFEDLPANAGMGEHGDIAADWLEGYVAHESAQPKRAGYVELRVVDRVDRNGEDGRPKQKAVRLRRAAELAAELAEQRPDATIGVLVRTNSSVARLLMELGPSRLNVRASGRGGGPLIDTPAVNALLDLLRIVDHPDDTTAAFNVATSPLGAVVELTRFGDGAARRTVADRVRRALFSHGYAMTLAKLAAQIAPACDAREIRRVYQLVELAGQFDQQPSLRADDFITLAEKKAVASTQPARVQVMTVHQSKGLDFDIVILPDLESRLTGSQPPTVLTERNGETGPITRICRYFSKDLEPFMPELVPLRERNIQRTVRESLSVLYVALTRAKHAVHILIDPPRTNERTVSCTAANVMRFALTEGNLEPNTVAHAKGDPHWQLDSPAAPSEDAAPRPQQPIRFAAPTKAARGRAASPSMLAETDDSDATKVWRAHFNTEARDRGTAIHELMQHVEWLDDFAMTDEQLGTIIQARLPRRSDAWIEKQVADFRAMLKSSEIAAALTRPAGDVAVWRELPTARLTDQGVQSGAIDRLTFWRDGKQIVRAEVLDFKTDAIDADSIDAQTEHHRSQLEAYRSAAAELLGIEPVAIAMKIAFVSVGRVITL